MTDDVIAKDEHLGWACDCPHNEPQCVAIDHDSPRALKPACTRPAGHEGPHSYCGRKHPECAWWRGKLAQDNHCYHQVSEERLYHYRCGNCDQWWSVADYHLTVPFCPFCGHQDHAGHQPESGRRP